MLGRKATEDTDQPKAVAAKKPDSSGSTNGKYYSIEVRNTSVLSPLVLPSEAGEKPFVIDGIWRAWSLTHGPSQFGVNVPARSWDHAAIDHGLVTYAAAEAHRWALMAYLESYAGFSSVETRLVCVDFATSYTITECGVSVAMQGPRRAWDAFSPRDEEARP